MALSALAALCACEKSAPESVHRSHALAAGRPAQFTRDVAAIDAAALRGDRKAVQANLRDAQDNFRRSMKLPDPTRPVDKEACQGGRQAGAGRSLGGLARSRETCS
jgi:hypothetical protein